LGSLETEAVKCGHEFRGTGTREMLHWRGPAGIINDRLILSSERMLNKDYNRKDLFVKKKILLVVSLKGLYAKTN
jgi:hypothetical protein